MRKILMLLDGRDELPQGVRVRIALDVVTEVLRHGDATLGPRAPSSTLRIGEVRVDDGGFATMERIDCSGPGIDLLAWELLAGRAAPEDGRIPRLRDVVDEIPTDLDELFASVLGGDAKPDLESFTETFTDTCRQLASSHEEVRRALGAGRSEPAPAAAVPVSYPSVEAVEEPAPDTVPVPRLQELRNLLRESSLPPPLDGAERLSSDGTPRLLHAFCDGSRYSIGKEPFVIGRSRDATDLRIADPTVTRYHAIVEFYEGRHWLMDLGSCNGIEYGGTVIERKAIAEGDVFVIGGHEIRFRYE